MAAVASIASIVLFLAFMTLGAQKLVFNPAMSHAADRARLTRSAFRRVGAVELVGSLGVLAGLAATGDALATINEAAAGLLVLVSGVVVARLWRSQMALRFWAPTLGLAALALAEGVVRLTL
ncbi:MAG: DoxX family protein [Acidimicrobiales bacterium]